MHKYKIVKFLNNNKVVLTKNDGTFLASFADVPYSGPEVLVFPCDTEGNVTDWCEVDGGRGYKNLQEFLTKTTSTL